VNYSSKVDEYNKQVHGIEEASSGAEDDEQALTAIHEGIGRETGLPVPTEEARKRLPKRISASFTRKGRQNGLPPAAKAESGSPR
jgi:hypothetical protein